MIVIKLRGGLANQMFQYALGRHLCIINKVPLYLDLVHYSDEQTEEKTIRDFGLNVCNIQAKIASEQQINDAKGWFNNPLKRKVNTLFNKSKPYYKVNILKEHQIGFDENILKAPKNCYVQGFWQSENYFEEIRDIILKDLSFKVEPIGANLNYLNEIKDCNSVSIHVRRGDYVNSKHYQNIHEVLTVNYYNKAIKTILDSIKDPVFYVFSDDPVWVKQNLKSEYKMVFVDHNMDTPHEDIRLMQYCKHNIIANSTFSWWAAWLNNNPDKIVVAPDKWYKKVDLENPDITPCSWIKIKNEN